MQWGLKVDISPMIPDTRHII